LTIFVIYYLALLAHEAWVLHSDRAKQLGHVTNLGTFLTTAQAKYPNKTALRKNLALHLRRAAELHELAAGRRSASNAFEVGRAATLLRKALVVEAAH